MFQRAADTAVLGIFSILYSCAVFVLKHRRRTSTTLTRQPAAIHPQRV
jgi:hypothetical protein